MGKVLIIDDDAQLRNSFRKVLSVEGHDPILAASGEAGVEMVKAHAPDLVIVDLRLPGMDGLETFKEINKIEARLPVIIMTAYGAADTAIEGAKLGAYDYILKPFEMPEMLDLINKALETGRIARSPVRFDIGPDSLSDSVFLGKSRVMQEVYKAIGKVASTDATVLIRGESGTGKELVARAVFQHSNRSKSPFTVVNCVAIPETLLESELFGYEKGAFTGANHRRIGKIEQANRGTIFLDEIGDVPIGIQAKMLRLLQERTIERLGGREVVPVDVRIIAATNSDLEQAIDEGRFREDLYYRLKVVTLQLPPLRERSGDIPRLAEHFLRLHSKKMETDYHGFTKEAMDAMEAYHWPGNVRELSNSIQKALIFNRGGPITENEMKQILVNGSAQLGQSFTEEGESAKDWISRALSSGGGEHIFADLVDEFSALIITEALNRTRGNRSKAAKLLGLSRPTLLAKIDKYGVSIRTEASSVRLEGE